MVVGVVRLHLQLHASFSLKEKRSTLKSVLARMRQRFPVSAAEVDLQDNWSQSIIGLSMVGASKQGMQAIFDKLENEILRQGEIDILASDVEWLQYS